MGFKRVSSNLTEKLIGGVQSVDVTSSSGHAELDQAAITAAYTYSFEPARNIYDEPVACRVNRSFSFS